MLKVLGIAGSLRSGSYNKQLLQLLVNSAPEGLEVEVFNLFDIPIYNGDVEAQGLPESVLDLKQRIKEADGILIVTPEYNYSIPGVLKNSIDWASRPPENPFSTKPVAIAGASNGGFGTVRSQHHLRQVMVNLNAYVMPKPEIMVSKAQDKFAEDGSLLDEKLKTSAQEFMQEFKNWIEKLS